MTLPGVAANFYPFTKGPTMYRRRMTLLMGFVWTLAFLPPAAWAQGGGIQYSSTDTRHFEGERFITLGPVRVHERPSAEAAVVSDVARQRMVYARPAPEAGWLQLVGAGVQKHPYARQGKLDPVDVENGKLVLEEEGIDRNVYRRVAGYVRADSLDSLDHPLALPADLRSQLVPIPGPLEAIGVKERRFVPREPLSAPFRSVMGLRLTDPGTANSYLCTGFVVGRPGLIATSGHCFLEGRDRWKIELMVLDEAQAWQAVAVPAQLLYFLAPTSGVKRADSALLEVRDPRVLAIPALALAGPGPWLQAGAIEVMQLGFSDDLQAHKRHWAKHTGVPHGDICTLSAGQLWLQPEPPRAFSLRPLQSRSCVMDGGDSGGPLLLWNAQARRYEVVGVTTHTWVNNLERAMTPEARALLESTRRAQEAQLRQPLGPLPQGMGMLSHRIDQSSQTYAHGQGWFLDERLYQEVAVRSGQSSVFPALWAALAKGPPVVSLQDPVTYHVNSDSFIRGFRDARRQLNVPLPAADAKQAAQSYGSYISVESLKEQGVVSNVFRLGKVLEAGQLLVPARDFGAYAAALQPQIDAMLKAQPHLAASVQREIKRMEEYAVIEAGPDLYVAQVSAEGAVVTEVIRHWMKS